MTSVTKSLTILSVATFLSGAPLSPALPAMAQPNPAPQPSPFRAKMGLNETRVTLTRDVAAQKFMALLRMFSANPDRQTQPDEAMMSSFSVSSETDNLLPFIFKLSKQLGETEQKVAVQDEADKVATVVVESKPRPLAMVQEGKGWGVDVAETFAKWNNLEGAAKTAALAQVIAEFKQESDGARRNSCQSNMKQMSLGILQYAQDYDVKYPDAQKWIDKIMPYVKSEQLFRCPSVTEPRGYGYAFNLNLSLQPLAALDNVSQTVSIYETTILERNTFGIGDEPAFRHQDGANYAFADGHVKWFPKTEIPSFKLKP